MACIGYREALVCEVVGCSQRPVLTQRPKLLDVVGGARAGLYKGTLRTEHSFHALPVPLVLDGLARVERNDLT